MNRGENESHKAIGVYTNGRFGRFVGNNIKANGTHNRGLLKERAHAYGFVNYGLHTIITSNNIIGEWGGKCIGLDNNGEYAIIDCNKILSTHTICGRSVCNVLDCGIFAYKTVGVIHNNMVVSYPETIAQADGKNAMLKLKLNEEMIQSIITE